MTNNGWISVEDRLPEYNERVLTYVPNPEYSTFKISILRGWALRCPAHQITHWLPLPEPPEED